MSSELLAGLIGAVISFLSAAALYARQGAAEKKLFLEMVETQNRKVAQLERRVRKLSMGYLREKDRSNKLQDDVDRLRQERDECSDSVLKLEKRLAVYEESNKL